MVSLLCIVGHTNFEAMASSFEEILWRYDMWLSDGYVERPRSILLCKDPVLHGEGLYQVTAISPGGQSSACAHADVMRFQPESESEQVLVLWDAGKPLPTVGASRFALVDVNTQPVSEAAFAVDHACTPVCLNDPTSDSVRVLELCAGSYGGWHKACTFLEEACSHSFQVMSVEACLKTAWCFAVSNGAPLISGRASLPAGFLDCHKHLVVHADISEPSWLSLAGLWAPEVLVASPPCQPWSTAGSSMGLSAVEGQVFGHAIAAAKILRPRILLIEQVLGFASHEDKPLVMRLLRWAGYCVKFAKAVESADFGAAFRARWLILAVRVGDESITPGDFQMWTAVANFSPLTFGALLGYPWNQDPRLTLTEEVLAKSSDHALLPPAKRKLVSVGAVLSSRCFPASQKVPTVVASYGSQHKFSDSSLQTKGLLNHFLIEAGKGPRHWHPVEILLMHLFVGQQLVLDDWVEAYRHLGNQITVPHAVLLLVNALNFLGRSDHPIQIEDVMKRLIDQHVTADNMHFMHTLVGVLVSGRPIGLTVDQVNQIELFGTSIPSEFPTDQVWTCDGFAPLLDLAVGHVSHASVVDHTQAFLVFLPVVCIGRPLMRVWVDSSIPLDHLEAFWGGFFEFFHSPSEVIMSEALEPLKPTFEPEVVAVQVDDSLYILSVSEAALSWVRSKLAVPTDLFGAVAGKLRPMMLIRESFPVTPDLMAQTTMDFVCAARACKYSVFQKNDGKEFGVKVSGPTAPLRKVLDFWAGLCPTLGLENLGYVAHWKIQLESFLLSFCASRVSVGAPAQLLTICLVVQGFRKAVGPLSTHGDMDCEVNLFSRPLWQGKLLWNLSLDFVMELVGCVGFWITPTFRVLSFGRQVDWSTKLGDLKGTRQTLKLYLMLPTRGGAPSVGKISHKQQIQNALAAALLEEGYELAWVSETIEKVCAKVGLKDLSKMLNGNSYSRLQAARQIITDCGFSMPDVKPVKTSQAALQAKKPRVSMLPNPINYRVLEGALLNQDDQPTQFTQTFGGQATGYHCILPKDAQPWLESADLLSKDELVLLIFGDVEGPSMRKVEKATVPCIDEVGRNVLVACSLVQCGEKQVKINTGDGYKVGQDATTLLAATVELEDWKDTWKDIVRAPFKFFRSLPFFADEIVSIWGKSFRRGRQVTSPDDSTSLQVHLLVKTASVVKIMRAAGAQSVWLTPKGADGKPDLSWKLIWLEPSTDIRSASIASAKIAEAAGIIKIKGRFALRISKANFATAWGLIYPNQDVPAIVDASRTWKLESLPFGVTRAMLIDWAGHNKWSIKPLRAAGPRAWVIGSSDDPPKCNLHFNSEPILIKEIKPRQPPPNPIVAGPRPRALPAATQDDTKVLPPLRGDPWAPNSNPWANWKSSTASAPAAPSAPMVGPTEQKFQQQEQRIAHMESVITKIQQDQATANENVENLKQEVVQRDEAMKQQIDTRLHGIKKELDASFSAALVKQTQSFDQSLSEIKRLLTNNKRGPQEDHAMEG